MSCTASGICYSNAPLKTVACPKTRQIAILPLPPPPMPVVCEGDGDWVASRLFPEASDDELSRYCVYEWHGGPVPKVSLLPPTAKPDCNVVAAHGSQWSQDNAAAYETAFLDQIDDRTPPTVTLPKFPPPPNPPIRARMMVVDSAINTGFPEPGEGQLEHGRIMGEIGRKLGCPLGDTSPTCRVDVASTLAIALERDGMTSQLVVNTSSGGFVGRLSDTARAIVSAVDYAASQGSGPIVVNLSLGWDPYWGGDVSNGWNTLEAPMRAVYSAVTYAACRGALVIAAAGNLSGGAVGSPGPAFPAGWETEPAPDATRCAPLGVTLGSTAGAYTPLLYAVGAVDGRDRPLIIERPDSRPRLVAPADHVAMTRVGEAHSTALSGTSVAAAAVSATAGTVWAYQPTWSRHQVMDLIYNRAISLPGVGVDFCNNTSCATQTRRVSFCRAVRRVCVLRQDCDSVPVCDAGSPGLDQSATNLTFTASNMTEIDFGGTVTGQELGFPCNATLYSHAAEGTSNPCPSAQFHTAYSVPHMVPQPIIIACPSCGLFLGDIPSALLYMGIDFDAPDDITDAKLRIVGFDDKESVYDLHEVPPGPIQGQYFKVTDIPLTSADVSKASIEFVVDGQYAQADPVTLIYE
ncbi:MAG: S8 family serine peptidase [Deltaproteobacteria bacterium]